MTHDEEMLAIERERLEMEKRRDRHASFRFLVGSVLLVAGTTGASLYINNEQEKRALVNSERQWVVPILMALEDSSFDIRINKIDSLLSIELTRPTTSYLKGERKAAVIAKREYQQKEKVEIAAKKKAREKQRLAAKAEKEAQKARNQALAVKKRKKIEEEARLAKIAAQDAAQKAVIAENEKNKFIANQSIQRMQRSLRVY